MGTSAPCPHCGAPPGAPGERPDPMWRAVDALYQEVARIRGLAETSADQSEEIRMLRETVARLRGGSVAALQYGHHSQNGNGHGQNAAGQHAQHDTQHDNGQHVARAAHRPAITSSLASESHRSPAA